MNADQGEHLAGEGAVPLDPAEQARWNAVAAHTSDAAEAIATGDAEGFAAAFAALRQTSVDLERVRDALHVPPDAGEWAPALEQILRRIPDGWGRWISCGPGWYPILARLDTGLAAIDPGYVVQQVKEKFGGLRYYTEPSPPPCCRVWESTHPLPGPDDHRACETWDEAFAAHQDSPEHAAGSAAMAARQEAMHAEITRAEAEAAITCELTGAPGSLMVTRSGWYRTLAPEAEAAEGYRPVQR
jgi:hypothetical protein